MGPGELRGFSGSPSIVFIFILFFIEMGLVEAGEITAGPGFVVLAQDLTSGTELKGLGAPSFHELATPGPSTRLQKMLGSPLTLSTPPLCPLHNLRPGQMSLGTVSRTGPHL